MLSNEDVASMAEATCGRTAKPMGEKNMLKLRHAPNTRAVRIVWLLEEPKLAYESNLMEFHPRALKSDEHRARWAGCRCRRTAK